MAADQKSESWICTFMDAMPFNLEFELTDLKIIDMLPRHCAFEMRMTEAAETMLDIRSPHNYEKLNIQIDDSIQLLRDGEWLECSETYSAGTLGVLWSWQLVLHHNWKWCAVSQNWWETLGVCDRDERCAILPVQYFRRLAKHTGQIGVKDETPVDKWPSELLADIKRGELPLKPRRQFTCFL